MSLRNSGNNAIHVEVCFERCEYRLDDLAMVVEPQLRNYLEVHRLLPLNKSIHIDKDLLDSSYAEEFRWIQFFVLESDKRDDHKKELFDAVNDLDRLVFNFYVPFEREMELEMFDIDSGGDDVPSSNHWLMPSNDFFDLWENLIYENGLKEKLIRFALSALTFSQHQINKNIISCNRLILLHGPPGTGKTSLCKALAQKLAIRTNRVFRYSHLIEINSHSLFSKWFSESGKLVMRLFTKIRELIADRENLVCVLIDEVESLAYARDSMSGQEPKDAMRVVNALLTQLDSIKEHPNVLILATSNLVDTIDVAFLDRADIKQYIGLPSKKAIRRIYDTMIQEMIRAGIIFEKKSNAKDDSEGLLRILSERSVGLSGRTLRKLPFLAHSVYMSTAQFDTKEKVPLSVFLDALLDALENHQCDQSWMKKL